MAKQKGKMTKTTFKEKSMKKRSLVTKKHPTDNIRPKENPTTLTSHPTTSHNIKLTKREDVRDCLKNNCVCTRLSAKNLHMYMTFGQKPTYREKAVVKSRPSVKPIKGSVNG